MHDLQALQNEMLRQWRIDSVKAKDEAAKEKLAAKIVKQAGERIDHIAAYLAAVTASIQESP